MKQTNGYFAGNNSRKSIYTHFGRITKVSITSSNSTITVPNGVIIAYIKNMAKLRQNTSTHRILINVHIKFALC